MKKNKKLKPKQSLTLTGPQQANEVVLNMFSDVNRLIDDKIMSLNPVQRFVMKGRVLNLLVGNHFRLTMESISDILNKKESSNDL